MVNIFNIPLYYISFNKQPNLEKQFKSYGFTNINHFQAIDGRKMDPKKLVESNIISPRSYNDLVYGREQHTGLSSLGAVGCTMSHSALWEKCVDNNLPYIIIAEDDAKFSRKLSKYDIDNITKALLAPNGGFINTYNFKKGREYFFGTHFYFLSNGACKELVKSCYPIDLQTDCYMNYLNNTGKISLEGYEIVRQSLHASSVQDKCVKCYLPKSWWFYVLIIIGISLFIGILISFGIYMYKKYSKTKFALDSLRSSCSQRSED